MNMEDDTKRETRKDYISRQICIPYKWMESEVNWGYSTKTVLISVHPNDTIWDTVIHMNDNFVPFNFLQMKKISIFRGPNKDEVHLSRDVIWRHVREEDVVTFDADNSKLEVVIKDSVISPSPQSRKRVKAEK